MKYQPSAVALKAYQLTKENGGVTIGLDGKQPTEGFAYAPSKGTEVVMSIGKLTPKAFDDFKNRNLELLKQNGNHIGGWRDKRKAYLDVSRVGKPSAKTLDAAQKASQLGVFDLKNFSDITVGKMENGVYTKMDKATSLFGKYQMALA